MVTHDCSPSLMDLLTPTFHNTYPFGGGVWNGTENGESVMETCKYLADPSSMMTMVPFINNIVASNGTCAREGRVPRRPLHCSRSAVFLQLHQV